VNPSMKPNGAPQAAAPAGPGAARSEILSHEDRQLALDRARERLHRSGPLDVWRLRRAVGAEVARRDFDECLLRLEREGALTLTPHARPEMLDALELDDCVPSSRGPLYFVTWRR